MLKNLIFIGIFSFAQANLFAQCNYVNNTFSSGEFVSYRVYYKLGFIWFNAAEATFQVKEKTYEQKKVLHLSSYGGTLPNYDWIFRVRDYFNAYVDSSTLSPLYFSRITSEGNYKVNNRYVFSAKDQKIYSSIENSKTPKFRDTLHMQPCTFDVLSAIYACRNIATEKLKRNDTIPINMLVDNEIYALYLRYLGLEQIETQEGEKYDCTKFTILMVAGTIFTGGEDITVWISNDKAKIPIKVEAKILVGAVIAYVDKVKGNKWPLSSHIIDNYEKE